MFEKQMIIAHRGASGDYHENTIEAFIEAINVGADAIELDVRKTKDNKIIISHDDNIDGIKLDSLDYNEILEVSSSKGFIVPTLEEVLKLCQGKILLDIELKEEGYEEEVISLIKKYLEYNEFFIRSFIDRQVRIVKKIDSKIKTGLLLGVGNPKYGFLTRLSELFPIFRIIRTKPNFISPHYRLMKFGYTKRMHLLKKPVIVWTVNDENLINKFLFKHKVDGLITDYPKLAINIQKNAD
ncbi:MAG TPA: glycerophosphodiester phosphodiesterase [Acholeplasmataceae bacterium]|nr:glycerophosphodiester phosphodiesterase [Acholeplasmataceae bacterium]